MHRMVINSINTIVGFFPAINMLLSPLDVIFILKGLYGVPFSQQGFLLCQAFTLCVQHFVFFFPLGEKRLMTFL